MANIDELVRDKLSKDGQVLNLKAQFLREVGVKELVKNEGLKIPLCVSWRSMTESTYEER